MLVVNVNEAAQTLPVFKFFVLKKDGLLQLCRYFRKFEQRHRMGIERKTKDRQMHQYTRSQGDILDYRRLHSLQTGEKA